MPRTSKRRTGRKTEPVPLKYPVSAAQAKAFARVLALASELPGVEESRAYGTPAIKVKGKFLARLRTEAEGGLALHCDFVDRNMLMQADPEVFYVTDHYTDYPMVLIDLAKVRWDAMPGLLEQAWRMVAQARLIRAHDEGAARARDAAPE
jgi:hypothetical protein